MRWWATLEWRFSVFPPRQQREKQPTGRRLLHVASLLLLSLRMEEHLCALCRKGGKRLEQVHPEGAICVTTWSSVTRFNQPIDKKKLEKGNCICTELFSLLFEQCGSCVQSIYIALGILIYLIQRRCGRVPSDTIPSHWASREFWDVWGSWRVG